MKALIHLSLIQDCGPATVLRLLMALYLREKSSTDQSWEIRKPEMQELVQEAALLKLEQLYAFAHADFLSLGFSEKIATMLYEGLRSTKRLEQELQLAQEHAIRIVTLFDQEYPQELLSISVPPPVLYLAGGYLSSRKMIALVGSREPTSYAQKVIDYFVPALTHQGWSVVSGGARGVDTMVHRAALESGLTVAVIGSGLLQPYPSENKKLFDQLCHASGTMLSIFPLQAAPERWNFPARNRVIAGLSLATVVVQAAAKSGALITAHFALEQGRVVFAVPGSLFDQVSAGCHRLLKQGALLAESPEDLFEVIGSMVKRDDHAVSSCENVPQVNKSLFDSEQKIQDQAQEKISLDQNARNQTAQEKSEDLLLVHLEQELSVDELAFMTGQEVTAIQQRLFDLQLEGKIEQDFAGLWRIRKSKK